MKKERSSNFELLRIISMFLIVLFHLFVFSLSSTPTANTISQYLFYAIGMWGIMGVCCFQFISGWFCIKKEYTFKFSKVLKLTIETMFYGLILLIVAKYLGYAELCFQTISYSTLFFFTGRYWYITTYVVFLFLTPSLNKIIFSLQMKDYKKIIIILTMIVSVYKTFYTGAYVSNILYFIYLYLLIGYLKLNPNNFFERNAKKGLVMTSIFSVCTAFFLSILRYHTTNSWVLRHVALVSSHYSFFMIIVALFMFYTFKNLKIKKSKVINIIGRSTLGVFLIHYNVYVNFSIIKNVFKIEKYAYSKRLVIYGLICGIIIYVICTIIDIIRIYLLEKPIVDKILKKLKFTKLDNFINLKD